MEEINLKDLFLYFVKKIPIILMISFVVMALGMLYTTLLKKPLYYGKVTLILVQENKGYNQTTGITQSDLALNQKLVSTYTEIIKSKRVLSKVLEELKLDYTVEGLASKIKVSSVSDTEIIKIAVSDNNGSDAAIIANKIAGVFKEEITDIYNLENVSIIDAAEKEEVPYNINYIRDIAISFIIGFILASGIIFAIYYFDTSIKSAEEVEKRLDVPVIGTIPLSNRKGKK